MDARDYPSRGCNGGGYGRVIGARDRSVFCDKGGTDRKGTKGCGSKEREREDSGETQEGWWRWEAKGGGKCGAQFDSVTKEEGER